MSTIIRTIRIPLDAVYTQNADIGLYTANGVSELRYTESPLTGVATTYKEGLIIDIGTISHRADFRNGGAQVQVSDVEIILANAVNNEQFNYLLKYAGINLIGLVGEIEEYVGTESDSDATEVVSAFTGSFEIINWNELEYKITAKSSLSLRRNNYLCKKSGDVVIPATFGESDPDRGIHFKMLRSNNQVTKLKVEDFVSGGVSGTNYLNPKMSIFPVYQKTSDKTYSVRLGYIDGTAFPVDREDYFVGKWVQCVEGESENVGQWRKIISATRLTYGQMEIELELDSYWPKDLKGNYDGTYVEESPGTGVQTWLEFYSIDNEYVIDSAACTGFFDNSDNELDNDVEVYSENNSQINRVPNYGYITDIINTDKNKLTINPLVLNGEPTKLKSFWILPVASISRYNASNLGAWYINGDLPLSNYNKLENGIFTNGGLPPGHQVSDIVFTGANNVGDKNHSTYCDFNFLNTYASYFYVALSFNLPELPAGFKFDKAYLCAKIDSRTGHNEGTHEIRIRGYIDRVKKVLSGKALKDFNINNLTWGTIDSIPDFYYSSNIDTGNKNFYVDAPEVTGSYPIISGYKNFEMPGVTHENYVNIVEGIIMFFRNYALEVTTDYSKIYELVVMLEKEFDITEFIYV